MNFESHVPGEPDEDSRRARAREMWSSAAPEAAGLQPEPLRSSRSADPVLAALADLREEMSGQMRAVRREFISALSVWSPPADEAASNTAEEVRVLAADLRRGLETLLDCVRDVTQAIAASPSGPTAAEPVVPAVHETRDVLLDRLESQHAAIRARLAEVVAYIQSGTAATRSTQERLAALTVATEDLRDSLELADNDEQFTPDSAPVHADRSAPWPAESEEATDGNDVAGQDVGAANTASPEEIDGSRDDADSNDPDDPDDPDESDDAGQQMPAIGFADGSRAGERARSRAARLAPARPARPTWTYEDDPRQGSGRTDRSGHTDAGPRRSASPGPRSIWSQAPQGWAEEDAEVTSALSEDDEPGEDRPTPSSRWRRSRD